MIDPIDYWRFHEEFTVIEVALLSLGINPSDKPCVLSDTVKPKDFDAIFSGIRKAISSNKLKANIQYEYYNNGYGGSESEPNWYETSIEVCDLKTWLLSRNFKPSFFFPEETGAPDYLNVNHLRYSAKLAGTVKVWLAMENENLTTGKGPIPAMESYLTTNYKELGLIHKQDNSASGYKKGDINKGAITSMAKIANWKEKGGAPTTPASEPIPLYVDNWNKKGSVPYTPTSASIPPDEDVDSIDDIPF